MKVIWSKGASEQLEKLINARHDYAGKHSAQKAFQEITRMLDLATNQPQMGKPGMVAGTRELYPLRYRVVYAISHNCLNVIAVLPQWQRWPED